MQIIELRAENIKRLKAVRIKPTGHVVQITGKNGEGKTSVLDAISYALEGVEGLPSKPIREGQTSGGVYLDLGDMTVTRRFLDNGNTSLKVEGKDGARYPTPQKLLDGLLGKLGFDPLGFMRMKPHEQLAELRRLVKLDDAPEELDRLNAEDYKRRQDTNRDIKGIDAKLADIPEPVPDLPDAPLDLSELVEKINSAAVRNAGIEELARQIQTWVNNAKHVRTKAEAMAGRIEDLKVQLQAAIAERDKLNNEALEWAEKAEHAEKAAQKPEDLTELSEQFRNAQAVNAQITKRDQRNKLVEERRELEALSAKLTTAMKEREDKKAAAIAKADLPIEGLSFSGGEVTFKGLPLNQASSAEQLRVSMAVAMKANPELKVIRISDGSLLDDDSMAIIAELAESEAYQIWIERVDSTGKVGIVLQDGEVIAVNEDEPKPAAPAPAPKKAAKKARVQ